MKWQANDKILSRKFALLFPQSKKKGKKKNTVKQGKERNMEKDKGHLIKCSEDSGMIPTLRNDSLERQSLLRLTDS